MDNINPVTPTLREIEKELTSQIASAPNHHHQQKSYDARVLIRAAIFRLGEQV